MTRNYTLKKRAEKQAETRQRIVEAAVELHSTLGPARTPLSMIAERAGVQRHTLYAHFPDERSMLMACSGHTAALDPMPDAEPWRAVADRRERLRTGLTALYAWFARNAQLMACVLRDAEFYEPVQEIQKLRAAPRIQAYREVLGADLNVKQRALLNLALSFHTWRTLVSQSGMKEKAAVDAMVNAIVA